MPEHEPTTRIGEAERAAAQRALQEHLNAQRLLVEEYADRSAAAASATTASEIAALFTDLPAPHPKLPRQPGGAGRRPLVIVGAILAVVVVGFLMFAIGRGSESSPTLAPVPTEAAPTTLPPSTTTSNATSGSPSGTGSALPGSEQVRRTTQGQPITLSPGYRVDLDDLTSPNWSAASGCCGDVYFDSKGREVTFTNDYAAMTGPANYGSCSQATAYMRGQVERGGLSAGKDFCVRTTEDRFAVVTVLAASEQAFQFRVTVYDPPFT